MKKICAILFAMIVGAIAVTPMAAEPVYAAPDGASCGTTFLGLRPWYQGLTDENCNVITPDEGGGSGTGIRLNQFVWTAILNVMSDMFVIGGLAALGFLVFGGFKYIMSNGDPGQTASAKKTITSAVIGLIITVMASVIANTIINLLLAARGA